MILQEQKKRKLHGLHLLKRNHIANDWLIAMGKQLGHKLLGEEDSE
jgi:hypothetical protein